MSIVHKTEIGGTTGNHALDVYVKGGSGDPSTILGTVDSVTAAPTFTIDSLTGYGNDYFDSWYAYVVWDTGGAAAAPQGESQAITGYTSSTGTFAHAAFTAPLVAGDKVLISLGDPNAAGDASAANQATIIADVTGINGDAMRGTDSAALAASWTAALATTLGNFSAARIGYIDELAAANLPTDIAAIPTTMVGTNNAALASVCTEARLGRLTQDVTVGIKKGVARTIVYKMVDATDFATPETGIAVTETISKDGGAFNDCTNDDAEISDGWYKILLTSTEMTANEIIFKGTGAGCAQCDRLIITEA